MKTKSFLVLFCFLSVGFFTAYFRYGTPMTQEIYTDSRGEKWRVPTATWASDALDYISQWIPRFNWKFKVINIDFDLEDRRYKETSLVYIVYIGLIGVLFLFIISVFLIMRYCCNCCGGKKLPRRGYSQMRISSLRMSILVFGFVLEGVLLYGFFSNSDVHTSLSKVLEVFKETADEMGEDINTFIETLPTQIGKSVYDDNIEAFKNDLKFSVRYSASQSSTRDDFVNSFERYRMIIVLVNLILATLGCGIGIAAGNVNKGGPAKAMVVFLAISGAIAAFSAGIHFAASKLLSDYCDEISPYLDDDNDEVIPTRLQYFLSCISSPTFPVIQDYYVIDMLQKLGDFTSLLKAQDNWGDQPEPQWFNLTNALYEETVSEYNDNDLTESYQKAVESTKVFQILDNNRHCTTTKTAMKNENFLMCTYLKNNLDVMTLCQIVGAVLMIVLAFQGIPAIKMFTWAGNANLGGVLAGNQLLRRGAKAKRHIQHRHGNR